MDVFYMLDREVRVPSSLRDIKLGAFVEYMDGLRNDMPKQLEEIITAKIDKVRRKKMQAIDDVMYGKIFLPYYAKYVAHFCEGLESDMALGQGKWKGKTKGMNKRQLEGLFWRIFKMFASYEHEGRKRSFEFNGGVWCFPDEAMKNSTLIEFVESAQFQKNAKELFGGKYAALPRVLAVIFRPEGEVYDDEKIDERVALFMKELSVDVALQGAFFLQRLNERFTINLEIYTMKKQLGRLKRERKN